METYASLGELETIVRCSDVGPSGQYVDERGWKRERMVELRILTHGVAVTSDDGSGLYFAAQWTELASVKTTFYRYIRKGEASDSSRLELVDLQGDKVSLSPLLPEAGEHLRELDRRAAPHIAARVVSRAMAGEEVRFGPMLTLTRAGLVVGNRPIAFAELAGWRLAQATLLIDIDPLRPSLVAEIPLDQLENSSALTLVLDRLYPDKNIDANPRYPRARFWRTTAATHGPKRLKAWLRVSLLSLLVVPVLLVVGMTMLRGPVSYAPPPRPHLDPDAILASMTRATLPTSSLATACAGQIIHPLDTQVLLTTDPAAQIDLTLASLTLPAHAATTQISWTNFTPGAGAFDGTEADVVVVRLLDDTHIGATSYAKAHVVLLDGRSGALRCQGLVDGTWARNPAARGLTPERLFTGGVMKLVLSGVCGASRGGGCDLHYATDRTDYSEVDYHGGPPDEPAKPSQSRARRRPH